MLAQTQALIPRGTPTTTSATNSTKPITASIKRRRHPFFRLVPIGFDHSKRTYEFRNLHVVRAFCSYAACSSAPLFPHEGEGLPWVVGTRGEYRDTLPPHGKRGYGKTALSAMLPGAFRRYPCEEPEIRRAFGMRHKERGLPALSPRPRTSL